MDDNSSPQLTPEAPLDPVASLKSAYQTSGSLSTYLRKRQTQNLPPAGASPKVPTLREWSLRPSVLRLSTTGDSLPSSRKGGAVQPTSNARVHCSTKCISRQQTGPLSTTSNMRQIHPMNYCCSGLTIEFMKVTELVERFPLVFLTGGFPMFKQKP